MEACGALLAKADINHSYPHCWRCKNPVIYRATPQWFVKVDKFRNETLEAIKGVKFIPSSGEARISNMVAGRTDWCISRQRAWGVPIPVFYCEECGESIVTDETIEHILDLCDKEFIVGLSILGGEPMHPKNIEGTTKLAASFKERFPKKTLWTWSGFLFDRDLKDKEVMKYVDVLVDGQYKDELHDFRLEWRGSSNQRVIDVQKSLKKGEVVLYTE